MITFKTVTDDQTESMAAQFAAVVEKGLIIHLVGDLGAGKTTFARGFLRGLGYKGAVRSPTYNIVQIYQTDKFTIYHFDLYRLSDPEEIEAMGIRDYLDTDAICLFEWPEKAVGLIPEPDILITLEFDGKGRQIMVDALSKTGHKITALVYDKKLI